MEREREKERQREREGGPALGAKSNRSHSRKDSRPGWTRLFPRIPPSIFLPLPSPLSPRPCPTETRALRHAYPLRGCPGSLSRSGPRHAGISRASAGPEGSGEGPASGSRSPWPRAVGSRIRRPGPGRATTLSVTFCSGRVTATRRSLSNK